MTGRTCTIYIVRHGETEHNINVITQGQTDSPLTKIGIEQARILETEFWHVHFDAVFSSDLLRAKRTAEIITLNRGLVVNTSKLLRERTFGRFEGRPAKLFREENKVIIEKLKTLERAERRKVKFGPDVESDEEITNRLILFLRELAVTYPNKTVLVVSHGGIMRAFLNHLSWSDEDLPPGSIKNTAYIKLITDGVDFFVEETKGIERSSHT